MRVTSQLCERTLAAILFAASVPLTAAAQSGESTAMPPAPPSDAGAAVQTQVQAARLSDIEGSVQVLDSGGKPFDQTRMNMPVLPGMQIKTGTDGRAEIQLPDGSVARITPNSALQLAPEPAGPGSGTQTGSQAEVITPNAGLTYFETPEDSSGQPSLLSIQVGPDRVSPAPGSLVRVGLDIEPAQVAILRGSAHFASQGAPGSQDVHFDLPANQTASIDLHAVMNYDVATSVSPDSWDAWNADRDAVLSSLAADQTAAREEAGNADDLGWNDLDYYGSWYSVPGYGMAWAPDNAGADFDPYGSGYWGYYTNVGYSWISAYPWGWLPYHCGEWNYFGGNAGWLWLPGACGPRHWLPYTPVRRGPAGYRPPMRPVPVVQRRYSLVSVNRTPPPAFRLAGEPKPATRRLAITNDSAQPVTATPYPVYSLFRAGDGGAAPAYRNAYTPPVRTGGSGLVGSAPSGRVYTPAPIDRHVYAPSPAPIARPAAPVALPRYEAPHAVAPAPAPAPAGRPR